MSYYGFKPGVASNNCDICQKNMYPTYQRPTCPHHHHNPSPTGSYYPPPPGSYYPPPPSGQYNPVPPSYPGSGYPQPPTNPSWSAPHTASYISYATWVDARLNDGMRMPGGAVRGGTDIDGQPIYVGRSFHEGDWLPAKVIPGKKSCYISYNGKEYLKQAFQILSDSNVRWVPGHGGQIPQDAVEGGKTANGEKLYIGRVSHRGSQTVGKIHPSHRTCYIPFDGKEIGYPNYEVLVSRRY